MESLGEHLKRERELKGITLRHISDVTKVPMRYLAALEENRFDVLPPEAFTKGFLRSYAMCVGLDPDEIILMYKQYIEGLHRPRAVPNAAQVSRPQPPAPAVPTPTKMSPVGSPKFVITLLCLFLVVAVSFFLFIHSRAMRGENNLAMRVVKKQVDARRGPNPQPTKPGTTSTTPRASVPGEEAPTAGPALPLSAGSPETEAKAVLPAKQERAGSPSPGMQPVVHEPATGAADHGPAKNLALTITAKEQTWIQAVIDGTERKEALLPAGSQVTWYAAEKFIFVVGNVRGTEMSLNGTEIRLPEGHQNVLRDFVVTSDLAK